MRYPCPNLSLSPQGAGRVRTFLAAAAAVRLASPTAFQVSQTFGELSIPAGSTPLVPSADLASLHARPDSQ